MKRMKKLLLGLTMTLGLLGMASCENVKGIGGNQMITGSKAYYYALVYSKITDTKYYHIKGWAEYGPEGVEVDSGGALGNWVGLELQLENNDVIYRYEQGLSYELSKNINQDYVTLYGLIGDK